MGDLRNKFAKIERAKAEKLWFESFMRRTGYKPMRLTVGPMPTCQCGLTYYQTEIVEHAPDRWGPSQYFCPACAPDEVKAIMGW
jgi:hypothetical protein